jgi:receptor protein-tyrosine kinase
VLGAGLALVRDLLDNTVKSVEDVEEVTGAPVMASVGIDKTMAKQPMLTDVKGFSPRGEAFRMLRTNLQYLDLDNPPKSLVITSAIAGEGKTSTSTNLAVALAQAGRRVLLIDGDLRRPRVASLLGLESSVGLTTVLVGRTKLEESIQRHQASGVYFLAGGPTPPNPTEVLQSQATHDLLAKLRAAYDAVIIDAPPLLPVADAAILGTAADGAILVTRHGKTHREELEAATQRLEKVGARLFGTVVNMIPKRSGGAYSYYYYYEYDTSTPRKTGGARVAK